MFKKLKQLNDEAIEWLNNPVVAPIDPKLITDEVKQRMLNTMNSITEERWNSKR